MTVRQGRPEKKPSGRERQKNRTRRAVVAAAAELIRDGRTPTVAEAAEAAEVSRATAYRYFPTQELLLAEVALLAAVEPIISVDDASPPSLPDAVAQLVRRVGEWAYENEQPLRTLLRVSLDPTSGVHRPAHRIGWITDVLAPARDQIDPATYEMLASALTLLLGIDPIIVMTDIAGATREQSLDALQWTARALTEAALRDGAAG